LITSCQGNNVVFTQQPLDRKYFLIYNAYILKFEVKKHKYKYYDEKRIKLQTRFKYRDAIDLAGLSTL